MVKLSTAKAKTYKGCCFKKILRDRNELTKRNFSRASNRYRNYNRYLYSEYVRRKQNDLKSNPKRFWSFVNEKRKESGLPAQMVYGDTTSSSLSETCNLFAKHFSSVFTTSNLNGQQIDEALKCVPVGVCDINITSFSQQEVQLAINQLKPSNSPGPDGIPSSVLRNCANSLVKPLQTIINQPLYQGVFPEDWKRSVIFPVFKKGNRSLVTNYRGITSLCAG